MGKPKKEPLRIYHGPDNIVGQARFLADWQREKKGAVSDFIVFNDNPYIPNSHHNLNLKQYSKPIALFKRFQFFLKALSSYDIFHFYFAKSLLPYSIDLPILKLFGKKILMNYVGSDIRITRIEKQRNPYYVLIEDYIKTTVPDILKIIRLKWQGIWCDKCLGNRGLYEFARVGFPEKKIIEDLWATNTIDMAEFEKPAHSRKVKKPVIIHAPTNVYHKGTAFITQAIQELTAEGYDFEFMLLQNQPQEEVQDIFKNKADIIVDQVIMGAFGSVSCEAMGYGKIACAYVLESTIQKYPDLPIIITTIDNLKEKIIWLLENRELWVDIGEKGWNFVNNHCNRVTICEKLWDLYLNL